MSSEFDPGAIWRKLPKDLKEQLQANSSRPLTDELLRKCHQAAEAAELPVFWRPDPETDYRQYRLHPDLAAYLTATNKTRR